MNGNRSQLELVRYQKGGCEHIGLIEKGQPLRLNPPDYVCCGAAWPPMSVDRHVIWARYYHVLFPDSKLVIFHDGDDTGMWSDPLAEVKYLSPRLGRPSNTNHAGFFRSFFQLLDFLPKVGKVVWLEWDFCIITQRFLDWIYDIDSGWRTVWCPQFSFPESSCQVICSDQLDAFESFYHSWMPRPKIEEIEKCIPFTEVNHGFIGGRYSDVGQSPQENADYIAQTNNQIAQLCVESLDVIK